MTKVTRLVLGMAVAGSLTGCTWFGGGGGEDLDAGRRFAGGAGGAGNPVVPARSTPGGVDQPGFIAPPESAAADTLNDGGVGTVRERVADRRSELVGSGGGAARTPGATPAPATRETPVPAPERVEVTGGDAPAVPDVIKEQVRVDNPAPPAQADARAVPKAAATRATTGGATGRANGTFMTLGGVVAEVNQRPIYANQVLREIVGPLSARARELDEQQFRAAALGLIDAQIKRLANSERETAVAERNLEEREKQQARMAAARWRTRQITEARGSLEMAKKKWAAEGYDFEERVDMEYRAILAQLYYAKKVWPRVQVTADEVRRYYQQHINDEFTVKDEVRFRAIKVDARRTGSREAALSKVTDLRARAARGEDFAALASSVNDDKYLMSRGGDVGWVQKGSYAVEAVEKAVWDLQPGQVTDIIDAGSAFYVAKLEERKLGRVMPFEEQAVQDKITKNLKAEQFRQLRDRVIESLAKNSVVRTDNDMVQTAVEMAMQNYERWRNGETG